jgi:hypothetical protein
MFNKYLENAELLHKSYTSHCLRHTYATEFLNAGMRLECLQVLMGHSNFDQSMARSPGGTVGLLAHICPATSFQIENGGICTSVSGQQPSSIKLGV